ncbi:hypothetical protein DPMN_081488 [Dreissena polymorpha]|uniref:Uncharacterized protein n=1 Tax=Dreissena polymorpha TaxID=45954 RepID=A0A9D3Y8R2_DREPO|nr:hypothetical protein DPMN_081488 [Dreissena polymorpha]
MPELDERRNCMNDCNMDALLGQPSIREVTHVDQKFIVTSPSQECASFMDMKNT